MGYLQEGKYATLGEILYDHLGIDERQNGWNLLGDYVFWKSFTY